MERYSATITIWANQAVLAQRSTKKENCGSAGGRGGGGGAFHTHDNVRAGAQRGTHAAGT
jgi:hypothetical protein